MLFIQVRRHAVALQLHDPVPELPTLLVLIIYDRFTMSSSLMD